MFAGVFRKDATYEKQDIDKYGRTVAVVTCAGVEANRT
jgi:micrococcal nuclease